MKRISKLLIVAILCTFCLALFACGKVDSIYFETEPRKTYVQGQDFTLENAVLVARSKKKTTPVNAEEATISGYNKDQLGEQTVTITYKEQTLDFKVTVIPRIALEGITREYFVGDKFDKTKGRLRIADDQANIKSVNMSENSVIVEGFTSETAGSKTLTVKYGEYTNTFTVNVFTAETVDLTSRPKKTTYYSHDTEFSIAGAFFTVTANNGSLTRMIEATPDMVTGFNPSAATMENMDSPLRQTVKFNYLGKSFDFNINIRFSAVSLVSLRSEELKDVELANATQEQKENALDALLKYADLTPSDQKLISSDVIQKLLEIGITYGAEVFAKEAETFSDTIKLETLKDSETNRRTGKINIIATSYDAVKADLERLQNKNESFLVLAATLYELKEEFYFRKVGEKSIDEILGNVFEVSAIDEVTKAFKLLLELHETLLPVPADWKTTAPTLKDYKNEVHAAVATINASDYKAFDGSATIYSILSSWRTENDYFDIIYAYYYYNDKTNLVSALWEKVYLPGPLQELFTIHNLACQEAMNLSVGDDTSTFMYYYYRSNEIADKIKNSDNKLHIDIYKFLNFDRLISAYLFFGTAKIKDHEINGIAYVYHASSLIGNNAYDNLLSDFFELFKLSLQEGFSFQDEKVLELAHKMLNSYVAFTPSERFGFLGSLHCDYRITTSNELVLSHTIGEDGILTCYNYFTYLLYSTYKEVLSEEAYSVFSRLMEASEMYALRYHNPQIYNGFTDDNNVEHLGFLATMAAILEDASKLNESDKAPFAELLAEMTKLYNNEINSPSAPVLTEQQTALFEELKAAIETFHSFYNHASSEEVDSADKFKYYIIAFSAFERAKSLAADLRSTENEAVLYTLLYQQTAFNIAVEENVGVVNATYDYMLDGIGSIFYLTMLRTEVEGNNVCTIYLTYDISNFLNLAYDVILAEYNNAIDESYKDIILTLMAEYNLLSGDQISVLNLLGATDYYFDAIEHCFEKLYDAQTMNVTKLFLDSQRAYAAYEADSTAENKTAFVTAFATFKDAYAALADKGAFDANFKDAYVLYAAKYAAFTLIPV